jgi:hypothetical protein
VQLRGVAGNSDRVVEPSLSMHCDALRSVGVSEKYSVLRVQERSSSLVFLFSVFLQPVNTVNSPVVPIVERRERSTRRLSSTGEQRHARRRPPMMACGRRRVGRQDVSVLPPRGAGTQVSGSISSLLFSQLLSQV